MPKQFDILNFLEEKHKTLIDEYLELPDYNESNVSQAKKLMSMLEKSSSEIKLKFLKDLIEEIKSKV